MTEAACPSLSINEYNVINPCTCVQKVHAPSVLKRVLNAFFPNKNTTSCLLSVIWWEPKLDMVYIHFVHNFSIFYFKKGNLTSMSSFY